MEALARGDDLVDAAYYALPVLSWQAIVIGDPLYRPFAVPLSDQTKDISALPPALAGYAVVRRMIALDAAGKPADAISVGKDGMHQAPNLALGLALAQRFEDSGVRDQALWWLSEAARSAGTSAGDWGLIRESARFLAIHGGGAEATDLYRKLFLIYAIPVAVRASWLEEARVTALDAGDTGQAAEWKEELIRSIEKKSMGTAP
jgi:hypothetical protein